ncbi:hypothetical protein JZ751_012368 [Albula glossodonta]|uniref:Fibrinogen C-terminal domain-containing protein n=1 Tax=Albula glossodonta TaxID=121402 RepID=A0A8T2PSC6_9TELE|nr:hypothetical protein JZ751_012368 [Albula glossodonta]
MPFEAFLHLPPLSLPQPPHPLDCTHLFLNSFGRFPRDIVSAWLCWQELSQGTLEVGGGRGARYRWEDDRPRDCSDIYTNGQREDGIYSVFPTHYPAGFQVFCDMTTDGGGWTKHKHLRGSCGSCVFGNKRDVPSRTAYLS